MKKPGTYKIPFKRTHEYADMLEYTVSAEGDTIPLNKSSYYEAHEWRENIPFDATLQLTGTYRGRSAARVRVINVDNGERYSFSLSGFYDAVVAYGVSDGTIAGRWVFRKQGTNYAVYPLTEDS